ncbi:MAG: 3-isopropylmalate dehydrogenase, partial [Cylindrospermopsis raciborskii PAMP2012]|nr:3-isopropylmalate dehydrogenase [Cylindrospermopsis raciborskii PAMP2012]
SIENAVLQVLQQGDRTGDIMSPGMNLLGCRAMGDALMNILEKNS